MQEKQADRHWQTIEIPADEFNHRLNQLIETHSPTGALFSRLALIHQVAKAYAVEAVNQLNVTSTEIEIEEITDPPLYGYMPDDGPVIIQFRQIERGFL
ncbi:hypothetical protein IC229_11405 [Spirosoma sp. BT702]|uniref:Uncharacterized protein n=1 Tax=Spirosoma profusum TaxID=2771354 RepID=A0A927AQV9_9BACT|nr:hypothetical protein [Spirosoma profusum]MBD2701246.1 hypothetical protein [Spirosoma profusum]